jgi:hypothetical protein
MPGAVNKFVNKGDIIEQSKIVPIDLKRRKLRKARITICRGLKRFQTLGKHEAVLGLVHNHNGQTQSRQRQREALQRVENGC